MIMKLNRILFLMLFFVLFISCQKEENEIVQDTKETTITKASPLTGLLERVSQNPTSDDNVLDNTSCFTVSLPVTVIVNGQQITVSTETDYQLVQDAIDAFTNDDDIVNFIYPITITFQNFGTLTISNSSQLDDVIDNCDEDDGFDEIDCITINYPIALNVYNANNQLAETIVLSSDVQLFNFLQNIDNNEYLAIQYPISIVNSNNQTIVINNNDQLEDAIEDAIDDCGINSGGSGSADFTTILTNGSWYVSYYFHGQDETYLYTSYTFTFNTNGTVLAQGNQTVNGTWLKYTNGGDDYLELDFDGGTLSDLDDDWELIEFNENQIRLKDGSGSSTDYLYFSKN